MPIPSPTAHALPAVQNSQLPVAQPAGQPAQLSGQPAPTGNLILRNDTILGICEAIGQDFGFNPNWLRIPLAGGVLISPIASFGIYFALGLAVLMSRLIAPAPRQLAASQAAAKPQPQTAENQTHEERLAA